MVCEFAQIVNHEMRLTPSGGRFDPFRKQAQMFHQRLFMAVIEARQVEWSGRCLDAFFSALPLHAADARMRILQVVNRVVAGLFARKIEVEVHVMLGFTHDVKEARGVAADVFAQLLERHELTRAGRHRYLFTLFEQVGKLHQVYLEVIRDIAQRRKRGLDPRDVTVVIGTPDVDDLVESAIELVHVIGDIGCEVGSLTILASHHAILFVTEIGRTKPQGAALFINIAIVLQARDRGFDQAFVVQRALRKPAVEVDAKGVQVGTYDLDQRIQGVIEDYAILVFTEQAMGIVDQVVDVFFLVASGRIRADVGEGLRRGPMKPLTVFAVQIGGNIPDIIALVAVAGKIDFLAAEFEVAQPGGGTENMHLPAGIVDVVLSLHVVADEAQQIGQGGAIGGAATMTDVQRPGGIGRNEFDLDVTTLSDMAATEVFALLQNPVDDRLAGIAGEEEIDESRAGYFDAIDSVGAGNTIGNQLREFTRRHGSRFCQHQRDIRGVIALARLLRRSDLDVVAEIWRNLRSLLKLEQSLGDQIIDDLLQQLKPAPGWENDRGFYPS